MTKQEFINEVFELAYGDTMLKQELLHDNDYETVINKLKYFSDKALEADPENIDSPDNN